MSIRQEKCKEDKEMKKAFDLATVTWRVALAVALIGPWTIIGGPRQRVEAASPTVELIQPASVAYPLNTEAISVETASPAKTKGARIAQMVVPGIEVSVPQDRPATSLVTAALNPRDNDRFGICWVNGIDYADSETRYSRATDTGAQWTRWSLHWDKVEVNADGVFDWSKVQPVVEGDSEAGLHTDAILIGIPEGYKDTDNEENKITNIYTSTFRTEDGGYTDDRDEASSINENNHWARFVYETVSRYHSDVKYWEIWNEPDGTTGGDNDGYGPWIPPGTPLNDPKSNFYPRERYQRSYGRLLMVAYQAIKFADPEAKVLLGGMWYWEDPEWLTKVLDLIRRENRALAIKNGYFFDIVPLHLYDAPRNTIHYEGPLYKLESVLSEFNLEDKEIWINESGVAVWDDPEYQDEVLQHFGVESPDFDDEHKPWNRATEDEQASYVIQNYAYAMMGTEELPFTVERVFHHQLYDDGGPAADWNLWGLMRNEPDWLPFPNDGQPRPSHTAVEVISTYLEGADFIGRNQHSHNLWNGRKEWPPSYEQLVFYHKDRQELIWVLWATKMAGVTAEVSSWSGEKATLVQQDGITTTVKTQ